MKQYQKIIFIVTILLGYTTTLYSQNDREFASVDNNSNEAQVNNYISSFHPSLMLFDEEGIAAEDIALLLDQLHASDAESVDDESTDDFYLEENKQVNRNLKSTANTTTCLSSAEKTPNNIGLSNNHADCFVNSSLQLFKAIKRELNSNELQRMPYLIKFFNNILNNDQECRLLRDEMATEVIKDDQDLRGIIQDGTAQSCQDAAAFLRLLLAETKAPKLFFEEKLINKATGDVRTITAVSGEQILQVALPVENKAPIEMQYLINRMLVSTRQQRWIDKDINTPIVEVQSCLQLKEPIPSVFVLSISRFDYGDYATKNQRAILGFHNAITLPAAHGEQVVYEPVAIICHQGNSLEEGHYVTYCKEGKRWYTLDDDRVTISELKDDSIALQNCYLIAYEKILTYGPHHSSITNNSSMTNSANSELINKQKRLPNIYDFPPEEDGSEDEICDNKTSLKKRKM